MLGHRQALAKWCAQVDGVQRCAPGCSGGGEVAFQLGRPDPLLCDAVSEAEAERIGLVSLGG
jgi:hypothetical protein